MHGIVRRTALTSSLAMAIFLAFVPIASHALGVGKLKVLSVLNEPLNAEIEFTSITEKELKGLNVGLASRAEFDTAGVERLMFLSQIKFMVSKRLNGQYFLQIRTDQQIEEPFLHFLMQVEWPGGRLVREYTALIDPPFQVTGRASSVQASTVAPAITPTAPVAPPSPAIEIVVPPVAVPPAEMAPVQAPVTAATQPTETPATDVVSGETPKPEMMAAPTAVELEKPLTPETPGQDIVASTPTPEETVPNNVEPLDVVPRTEVTPEAVAETPFVPEIKDVSASSGISEYAVQKGDTLWEIANKSRVGKQANIEQMILAIFKSNEDAFFGNNLNNLKAGKILKLPEQEALEAIPASQARKEFRAQYDVWKEYKLRLAGSSQAIKMPDQAETVVPQAAEKSSVAPEQAQKKEATKTENLAGDSPDKSKETEDLLKIVRNTLRSEKSTPDKKVSETESAKEAAANERQALADRAATLEESIESKQLENKELSEKLGIVRSQLKKQARLIELENQSLAQAQKQAAEPKPAEPKPAEAVVKPAPIPPPIAKPVEAPKTEPVVEVPTPVADTPKPVIPAAKKPVTPPVPVVAEKGFLASLMEALQGDLLMPLLIGFFVLIGGGIALVYLRRRQKSIAEFEESILTTDTSTNTDQPVSSDTDAPAVTTGGDTSFLSDFSQGGMGNIHTDEVDPVAEADVYLAYGRDETAEEILKDAVVKNPDRHELRLKLLDIYHQRNDVASFETLAEELYAAVGGRGGKIWEKVEEMGRKLNPENPMFRGGASAAKAMPMAPAVKPDTTTAIAKTAIYTGTPDDVLPSANAVAPTQHVKAPSSDFDLDTGTSSSTASASDSVAFDLDLGEATDDIALDHNNIADFQKTAQGDSDSADINFGVVADNSVDFGFTKDAASKPTESSIATAGDSQSPQWDEAATKLDLAKAYIDMGDSEGARGILQEVMAEGNDTQKKQAQELASQIT